MKRIMNAAQMKAADLNTIENIGIPSMVLMERAALQVVSEIKCRCKNMDSILVVCGSGNNGGDGFAIARLLIDDEYDVDVVFTGKMESRSDETVQQMKILENMGISVGNSLPKREYSVIIDAMFGIGLCREITGHYRELIEEINDYDAYKVAVDIASGVSADSGEILGSAFRADLTVTFEYGKLGHYLYPGAEYSGHVVVKSIGIKEYDAEKEETYFTLDENTFYSMLPERKADSNKGTFGKVLVIAGSQGMAGAAYMCAKAVYRTGAGLVRIFTEESNRLILQQLLPEAIITTYTIGEDVLAEKLENLLEWSDVVCIGCGIGISKTSRTILDIVLKKNKKPCVIDADGLNLFARINIEDISFANGVPYIFTPHMGEMSRLTGCDVPRLKSERISVIKEYVNRIPIICVMKDSRTLIGKGGFPIYINCNGNSAMAKAGSGDVLAGIITGFLAQGLDAYDSSVLGVYTHGKSGDIARDKCGEYSVLAEDILDGISRALTSLEAD